MLPGFYDEKRVADFIAPGHYDEMILKGLKTYPERRDGIRRVSRQFATLVAPARHEFETYFGKMRNYPPIYLVVSFGEFDGGTRDLADGTHLMFGADVIDQIYKADTPIKPLVEHELFHLMHRRTFPDCDPVWCNLWEEGLATYVASTFNPGASDAALGLTIPQPIRPAVEARRNEAICAVRARLQLDQAGLLCVPVLRQPQGGRFPGADGLLCRAAGGDGGGQDAVAEGIGCPQPGTGAALGRAHTRRYGEIAREVNAADVARPRQRRGKRQ